MAWFVDGLQRHVGHAVGTQDSQCIESLRAVADDASDVVRHRQAIHPGNTENGQGRDPDYSRQ